MAPASYLAAPPRLDVAVAGIGFGRLGGPGVAHPKARAWIIVDEESLTGTLRYAVNDQSSRPDRVARTDVPGVIVAARVSRSRWELDVQPGDGSPVARWTMLMAPCVCGAGAVGHAGPTSERHQVRQVRNSLLSWYQQVR